MSAIAGTVMSFKSMADKSIRVTVEFQEPDSKAVKDLLCDVGATVAIARLTEPEGAGREQDESPDDGGLGNGEALYGHQAKLLRLSGFFRMPLVWQAVGTDAEYLSWLRTQKCAAIRLEWNSTAHCGGDVVGAHVRRIANGAGTGIKPQYSAISLCDIHHQMQHAAGESAFGGKEWFDKQRIEHLQAWCWERTKALLGYAHWNLVPPNKLIEWAAEKGVSQYLPSGYCE